MRTRRLIFVLVVIAILAISARWWLPALLYILSVNGDLIQSLDSAISIISSFVVVLSALGGYLLLKDKKEDAETLDQHNRRILLNHVENFWVKGILEKSLFGEALLELEIKENPDAVADYPWTIRKESTNEILPAGTSMFEIFEKIGVGRSLLILGAPGSGKSTMLFELARQLIERARQNETEPIPIVFNLASWTEKQTLADWLATELNAIYTVPKKTAPAWVKANKFLLLLDGLDEVKHEYRDKCIEAINQFRNEYGLTCMAVCSRSQEYGELKARLSFNGAIEIQSLTQEQIDGYFNRFGKKLAGVRQVLKKDTALRELAETPLFLSIMTLAYHDTPGADILVSENIVVQRKHLFDAYIERMFERPERAKKIQFKRPDVLRWLSWLARQMIQHNINPYEIEDIQPSWLESKSQNRLYNLFIGIIFAIFGWPLGYLIAVKVLMMMFGEDAIPSAVQNCGLASGVIFGLFGGLIGGLRSELTNRITTVDRLNLSWKVVRGRLIYGMIVGVISWLIYGPIVGLSGGLIAGPITGLVYGLVGEPIEKTTFPGQRLKQTLFNTIFILLIGGICLVIITELETASIITVIFVLFYGLNGAFGVALKGGLAIIEHFVLRFVLMLYALSPSRLILFLNYCTDLIFLRRVGGGYIFVHRLLMEHFAEMSTD